MMETFGTDPETSRQFLPVNDLTAAVALQPDSVGDILLGLRC